MNLKTLATGFCLSALLASTSYSQTTTSTTSNTSTSSLSKTLAKLKESPLGLRLYMGVGHQGTTTSLNGIDMTNIGYLSYKLTDKDSLRLENRWTVDMPSQGETKHSLARTVLKYTRSGLLTQEKNGVNLSAAVEKRVYPDKSTRNASNSYGLNRISASVSKKLNDTFSLGGTAYFAITDRINKNKNDSTKNYIYLVGTQTASLGKGMSLTLVEEVYHNNNELNINETNQVYLTMELSKQINPSLSAGFSIGAEPVLTKNGSWNSNSTWKDNLAYGMNLSLSAF